MFHHITDEEIEASPSCICNTHKFSTILEYLGQKKISVVSFDEAIENIKKRKLYGYAVLTFDDGLEDTYKIAYPLLKKFNYPFTIYITLNYLNRDGYISVDQLNILSKEPLCSIGAHTLSHPVLKTAENATEEIVKSKHDLEIIIGKEVVHFAYPYGGITTFSKSNIDDLKKAGYKSAVSSVGTKLNCFSTLNEFSLPRINGSLFMVDKR